MVGQRACLVPTRALSDLGKIVRRLLHSSALYNCFTLRLQAENQDDSDDEDGAPKESASSKLVKSSTKNVYRLVKAYVRKGAALCGLGAARPDGPSQPVPCQCGCGPHVEPV